MAAPPPGLRGLVAALRGRLAFPRGMTNVSAVWNDPYLETCCRAALHRAFLCGEAGRPDGLSDDACQRRLTAMDLCERLPNGRFRLTKNGRRRHATEVLKQAAAKPVARC